MIQFLSKYGIYLFSCAWSVFCLIGYLTVKRYINVMPIGRIFPQDGFPDDAARVRFWKSEPMYWRMTLDTRLFPQAAGIWIAGWFLIFSFMSNRMMGMGVLTILIGSIAFLLGRKKKGPGIRLNFIGGLRFFGMMDDPRSIRKEASHAPQEDQGAQGAQEISSEVNSSI
jgi:hypothetical protein